MILDGKVTSKALLQEIAQEVGRLTGPTKPKLVAVLVGENPASEIYVARKMKVADELGILSELHRFPAHTEEAFLKEELEKLNQDTSVNAVLVQLPLPKQIHTERVLQTILPEKDVDGFHPINMGQLLLGIEPPALPCTPAGIMKLLDAYKIDVSGLNACVVGRSNIVGKPIMLMLTQRNATVTLCHSKTRNLEAVLESSDLVVAAIGQAHLISGNTLKRGCIVVDVGINRLPSGQLVGDVDFESAREKAAFITPVPGGVGPMTIAMLMMNTLRLHQVQQGIQVKNWLL